MFNIFFSEHHTVYEIMWKNIVLPDRPQTKIQRMRIACWISNATNTHYKHIIILILSHCNNACSNTPQSYYIRTPPVLFNIKDGGDY